MNILAKEKAKELVNYFGNEIYLGTSIDIEVPDARVMAKLFALKLCSEIKGHMGADRGYLFWTDVEDYVKAY